MKLYYPITVDLYNLYPLKKMDAQQYNIGRGALVTLTAAGQVIAPDNETVTLWAKKPDNTVSYLPCTVENGQIKADFTNQMLALSGSVQVELRMIAGQDNITTPIFTVEVHPSNIDDDAVESQNEFTALQAAVSEINTALQEVDELKKTGLKGDPGEPGAPGAAATIEVGTVEAGQPGSNPQITNAGTSNAAVFNFVLPRGEAGPAGADGKEQVFFGAFTDFPAEGDSEMLYVDTSNTSVLLMYRWNGTTYVPSGGGAADLDVVAQEFDATKAYTKGTYVIYSGELYCFTSDKAAGAWDASVVTPTTVGVELSALNAKMSGIVLWKNSNPTDIFVAQTVSIPDLFDYNSLDFVARTFNGGAEAWRWGIYTYSTPIDNVTFFDSSNEYIVVALSAAKVLGDTKPWNVERIAKVYNDRIEFDVARYSSASANSPTISNGYMIPLLIIGHKS